MTKLGILTLFFRFLLVSLWFRGWRIDPTSVLPTGMPLSPITRDTVVIFSGHVKKQTMQTADRAD